MTTTKIYEQGGMCFRPQGHTPLPQRWLRARKWGTARHVDSFDIEELKQMRNQELKGRG